MATLKPLQIFHGPSPEGDEPTVSLLLTAEAAELADVPASAERLEELIGHWFTAPERPTADLLSAGRFTVALARALVNEHGGVVRVATARATDGGVRLVLGHHHPVASLRALETALSIALGAAKASEAALGKALQAFSAAVRGVTPDGQASLLLAHALERGVPARAIDWSARLWLHGWGARSEIVFESAPRGDSANGGQLVRVKALTKRLAVSAGFSVLPGAVVTKAEDLEAAARGIGFPCVTKPVDSGQSRGVTTAIRDLAELRAGWAEAQRLSKSGVLVERHADGEVHRLMVMRGKFWKAVQRPRPFVTGDGKSTVLALTEALNAGIARLVRPSALAGPVPRDAKFDLCLRRQGLTAATVPAAGARVIVRDVPLLSNGATEYADLTERVDPALRLACEQLAQLLGADSLGIDVVAGDIARAETCRFLEANLTPGLRLLRMAGVSVAEIGQAVLGDAPGRVPSTLVLAPREAHARIRGLAPAREGRGWTDGRAVGIGDRTFPTSVRTPHDGVELLVRNPAVTSLLVLADPADITSGGLPIDRVDTTVILAGTALPAEWEAVIRKLSGKVVSAKDEGEAVR